MAGREGGSSSNLDFARTSSGDKTESPTNRLQEQFMNIMDPGAALNRVADLLEQRYSDNPRGLDPSVPIFKTQRDKSNASDSAKGNDSVVAPSDRLRDEAKTGFESRSTASNFKASDSSNKANDILPQLELFDSSNPAKNGRSKSEMSNRSDSEMYDKANSAKDSNPKIGW